MTQRYRQEAPTLQALLQHDELLVGQCELFRSLVDSQDAAAILKKLPDLESGLDAIRSTLQKRGSVLLNPA
jgi:hypothetical protein